MAKYNNLLENKQQQQDQIDVFQVDMWAVYLCHREEKKTISFFFDN